jgi:hypothetical protein
MVPYVTVALIPENECRVRQPQAGRLNAAAEIFDLAL